MSLFDVNSFLDQISAPACKDAAAENLFSEKHKAWHGVQKEEARCDFSPNRFRLNSRGIMFVSLWKRSIYGRTLTDIKSDESMPRFLSNGIVSFIRKILGNNLSTGNWSLLVPPPRRHLENNFAMRCGTLIAADLCIPFRSGVTKSKNRQRVNAEFELLYVPPEANLIVFDDIVTTGSTFSAMDKILSPLGKTIIYVTAINNKS